MDLLKHPQTRRYDSVHEDERAGVVETVAQSLFSLGKRQAASVTLTLASMSNTQRRAGFSRIAAFTQIGTDVRERLCSRSNDGRPFASSTVNSDPTRSRAARVRWLRIPIADYAHSHAGVPAPVIVDRRYIIRQSAAINIRSSQPVCGRWNVGSVTVETRCSSEQVAVRRPAGLAVPMMLALENTRSGRSDGFLDRSIHRRRFLSRYLLKSRQNRARAAASCPGEH
ncbi:hypothetical protein SAMN04487926_13827 [Paraburkholderia steynii]|uniref:Uncharacterized protein n=1 Tax=Paraburkholderia steynii TaxID=1245441 RepID=A0A7Z7BH22_9BURK|nr:hypothetical protein SAMN04487926_13827 [Paraburkholderia steynii]